MYAQGGIFSWWKRSWQRQLVKGEIGFADGQSPPLTNCLELSATLPPRANPPNLVQGSERVSLLQVQGGFYFNCPTIKGKSLSCFRKNPPLKIDDRISKPTIDRCHLLVYIVNLKRGLWCQPNGLTCVNPTGWQVSTPQVDTKIGKSLIFNECRWSSSILFNLIYIFL